MMCRTLHQAERAFVDFDPTNTEHIEAFHALCLGQRSDAGHIHIKQHPTLRFYLEENFPDVRSMMFHKVGEYHHNQLVNRAAVR